MEEQQDKQAEESMEALYYEEQKKESNAVEQREQTEAQKNRNANYFLSLSIIVAAFLISSSLIYTAGLKNIDFGGKATEADKAPAVNSPGLENLKPITSEDHLFGNLSALVKIVEFSDLECPFCKRFHLTMKRIMDEYGRDNRAVWIYRHFPIEQLHSKAKKAAIASECANELGGNEKFWAYLDRYFEVTPSNNQIDLAQLPEIAKNIGLNKAKFEECLKSDKYNSRIESEIKNAMDSGGNGTPYSIVVSKNGKKYPINGALPYEQVKSIVEEALRN